MATKRANNEGSIRQRKDGTWEARVTIGTNPGTGNPIRKSLYGKTQKEVRVKLQEVTKQLSEGGYLEPSKMTVSTWLDTWLADYLGAVKPGTVTNYSMQVRVHIKPALGAVKLVALQPPMIQHLYNQLQDNGLSAKSIKNLHGCLHKALTVAVTVGYIYKNPAEACVLPRIVEKEIQPLDTPEITKLLNAIKGHEFETLIKAALFTGMRSGELLGLTWDCIDFENGSIFIRKQLLPPRRKGEVCTFGTLKNDRPRTVTPAPFVMQALKDHKRAQAQQRLSAGPLWNDEGFPGLVFTHQTGGHLTQSGVWKMLQRVLQSAGIEQRRFHDLRHTYAVSSLRSGDDVKTVQENLGHHTAAFTLDKYGHITETMKRESAARMEAFIEGIL